MKTQFKEDINKNEFKKKEKGSIEGGKYEGDFKRKKEKMAGKMKPKKEFHSKAEDKLVSYKEHKNK